MKPCVNASAVFALIAALTGADAVLAQDSGAPPSTADQVLLAPLARDTVVTVQQVREG